MLLAHWPLQKIAHFNSNVKCEVWFPGGHVCLCCYHKCALFITPKNNEPAHIELSCFKAINGNKVALVFKNVCWRDLKHYRRVKGTDKVFRNTRLHVGRASVREIRDWLLVGRLTLVQQRHIQTRFFCSRNGVGWGIVSEPNRQTNACLLHCYSFCHL